MLVINCRKRERKGGWRTACQRKVANSNAVSKRIKWMTDRSSFGRLNQKSWSRGLIETGTRGPGTDIFSSARVAITCCSFVPIMKTT